MRHQAPSNTKHQTQENNTQLETRRLKPQGTRHPTKPDTKYQTPDSVFLIKLYQTGEEGDVPGQAVHLPLLGGPDGVLE